MAARDKVTVNDSLASLDVEEAREPYRFALKGNKVITFPDPLDMDFQAAEDLVRALSAPEVSLSDAFERWLSPEDFEALKEAGLSLRQITALVRKVGAYYEDIFGTPGN